MKGDPKVLELLNEALKNELTATNQYWLHYRLLDNWGVHKLAQFERSESIDEMKHADLLAMGDRAAKLGQRFQLKLHVGSEHFLDIFADVEPAERLEIGQAIEE